MIGFFDSGFGGLTVLKEVVKLLPQYSFIYLGDNARTPYGDLDQETVYQFTKEGVIELFKRGAELVILACNTSSSAALRKIQQEFLPINFPDRKVLGIIIPTAEEIDSFTKSNEVGILATEATVHSGAYSAEIEKINSSVKVYEQACPLLVPAIEAGEEEWGNINPLIEKYLHELLSKSSKIDVVILGCTHYALIESQIRRRLPEDVKLINQGPIIASKLKNYLYRHLEVETKLQKNNERTFLSTEASGKVEFLSSLFYGEPVKIKFVNL